MITRLSRAAAGVIAALIAPVLAGCASDNELDLAVEGCVANEDDRRHVYVTDEGGTLILRTEGDESAGAPFLVLWCVYDHLDMPEAITSRISSTRALDGTQTGTWDRYSASWTYHPNSGLNLIIEHAR